MLGISLSSFAQEQTVLAKFKITEAKKNGVDVSNYYFERKQYFVFYFDKYKQFCMANVSGVNSDQSYGRLYSMQKEHIAETKNTYQINVFNFRWKYYNTYDNASGYASISLTKVYKPQGVMFILKMVLTNLDVVEYKGFMEGTLNFQDYFDN